MTFNGPLEERIAIRELLETYNDAVHRRDADAWSDTWTDDAEWDLLGHIVSGKAAIVETWKGAMAGFSYVGFTACPGSIDVAGHEATVRAYVRETLVDTDGNLRRVEGIYDDELVKSDSGWRFRKRVYKIAHDAQAE